MNTKQLSFIDFETTGSDAINDYPLHFGAVLINIPGFQIIKKFESYIQPPQNTRSTKIAYSIHRIKTEDIYDSPPIRNVLAEYFEQFGTNYSFAGWNVCFDISFFRKGCFYAGFYEQYMKINYRHLDVQSIAQALFVAGKLPIFDGSMTSLCNFFNLSRDSMHTGLQDAILSMQIYRKLLAIVK